MIITKNTKKFNSFNIEGITEGKLMAIARALQAQQDANTLSAVGHDVLQTILIALQNYRDNQKVLLAVD